MPARLRTISLAALCALALAAPPAAAHDARYEGSSGDGSIVFFSTDEAPSLLGDSDLKTDIYARAYDPAPGVEDFVTRKVSTGPAGGNDALDAFYAGAAEDGSVVVFSTREALVEADEDRASDVYARDLLANQTTLVSVAAPSCPDEGCGNAELNANFVQRGVTPDGARVFFVTAERLSSADTDNVADVYVRDLEAGTTTLVTRGDPSCQPEGCGNGAFPVLSFEDASADGTKVVFRSDEKLAAADVDGGVADLYRRDLVAGTTALVSTPGSCSACVPTFGAAAPDGSHVVFETSDPIAAGDSDGSQDVYDWNGTTATLVSTGPQGGNAAIAATFPGVVSGFPGISADGARIFFETDEQLVGNDEDSVNDVYERSGGVTALVSRRDASCEPDGCGDDEVPASFRWISPTDPGSAAIFGSAERLAAADTDQSQDVYRRSGGATTLLSTGSLGGNGAFNASFAGASATGAHVFFITAEPLEPLDADAGADIYDRFGGVASLVSTGPVGGNGPFSSGLTGVSAGGDRAFFTTDERLTVDDKDGEDRDVYERAPSGTLLVSTGNLVQLGPAPPAQLSTDPASPGSSTTPRIRGQVDAGATVQVYANAACAGEPVATGTASQLTGPGIGVTVKAGSTTSFWLTAEAEGITSPCAGPIAYAHQGPSGGDGGGDDGGGGGGDGGGGGGKVDKPTKPGGKTGGRDGASYVKPETLITFGPSFKTRKRKVVFRFTDSTGQADSRFRCKLDRGRWKGCGSPMRLRGLGRGAHVFIVKGVNAVGEPDASPAKRRFKVVPR